MKREADPRLQKLLGGDALVNLRQRMRRYFERMDLEAAAASILRVNALNTVEHEALSLLTGRSSRYVKSMQVDIAALDITLRDAGLANSLREALEQIDGPIVHRASAAAEQQALWFAVLATCRQPALINYLQTPTALGLLKRLARRDTAIAARIVAQVEAVLCRLPAPGLPLAQLAAETLGNAHALDSGQAVATLILSILRQRQRELSVGEGADDDEVEEKNRDIWARAGVAVNELARPALFLNLPTQPNKTSVCAFGEPAYLSLRQLLRCPPAWAVTDLPVFVCENPNVVAIAADTFGLHCAPLVCTEGMPAAAQRTLLTQLAQAGARLFYHGDFDWPGLHIANHVIHIYGATPWHLSASDYEAAVASAPHTQRDLADTPVMTSWDSTLPLSMQQHGLAIPEEAVASSLLADLQR